MNPTPLTDADEALVERAIDAAADAFQPGDEGRFDDDAHIVTAAVETATGAVHTGTSLPASIGRASGCAEPAALGSAVAAGDHEFVRIAAVEAPRNGENARVVSPCGVCRELLADYGDDLRVLVRTNDGAVGGVTAPTLLAARTW